jgi:hypothetical protein
MEGIMTAATGTTAQAWKIGDRVSVDDPKFPGVWTIVKRLQKNYLLEQDGNPRPLRCPASLFQPPGDASADDFRIPWLPATVVEYTGTNTNVRPGLYVVMSDTGQPVVRVTRLGGDQGNYWKLRARYLRVVDAEAVMTAYAKASAGKQPG